MKTPFLMPMNLQFFADDPADQTGTSTDDTGTNSGAKQEEKSTAGDDKTDDKELDSEKVVEKLQKRLASKTAAEKETKTQLEQALARIEELEKGGKKGVKDLSDEEKATKAQQEKEAGLTVGKDILSIVVSEDDVRTLANVKALINYTQDQQKQWEIKRNTGSTPKKTPGATETDPFKAVLNKY